MSDRVPGADFGHSRAELELVNASVLFQVNGRRTVDVEWVRNTVDVQTDGPVALEHQIMRLAVDVEPLAAWVIH